MEASTTDTDASAPDERVVQALVKERRRFQGFLLNRVGDPDLAEDLLQTAILQALRRAETLRDGERVVAWIYRILRNVLADYRRREAVAGRAAVQWAGFELPETPEPQIMSEICACVGGLLDTLPPQYAEALQLVELEELPPGHAAARLGLSTGNMRVRLHRARAALRERVEQMCRTCAHHGCLDCTCRTQEPA